MTVDISHVTPEQWVSVLKGADDSRKKGMLGAHQYIFLGNDGVAYLKENAAWENMRKLSIPQIAAISKAMFESIKARKEKGIDQARFSQITKNISGYTKKLIENKEEKTNNYFIDKIIVCFF